MKKANLAQSEIIDQIPLACADEAAALAMFEQQRWGDTPCCVHCGSTAVYTIKDRKTGERRADGRWRCRDCGKQYTVRTGQILEDSPLPLRKWAYAFWCAASAKNGVSALEMSRKLQVTYKSALFVMNRIRWAMRPENPPKLRDTIEADTTYVGGKPRIRRKGRFGPNPDRPKTPVLAIVQRGGDVRSRVIPRVTADNLGPAMLELADKSSNLVTDDRGFHGIAKDFATYNTVKHTHGEYVNRQNPAIHTNTVEGFFSRVKRQLTGTYHAVSKTHLQRYVDHAAYLYNARKMNDGERLTDLIRSADGKRIMHRDIVNKAI